MYQTIFTGGVSEKTCLWSATGEQKNNEAQEKVVCPCPWISFIDSIQKNIPCVVWKGKLSKCTRHLYWCVWWLEHCFSGDSIESCFRLRKWGILAVWSIYGTRGQNRSRSYIPWRMCFVTDSPWRPSGNASLYGSWNFCRLTNWEKHIIKSYNKG